jgi:CRP/FNR family cyclic AMP-dependent transcriptional regulator
MSPADVKPALRTHPFFEQLTDEELAAVAGCGQWAEFQPGQALTREGEDASHFYALWQGKVAVQTYVPGRGIVTLQTLRGGEVLGWSWSSPPSTWTFDSSAIEPTRAVQLCGPELLRLCEAWQPLGYKLMKGLVRVLSERLRCTRLQLLDLYAPPSASAAQPVRRKGALR